MTLKLTGALVGGLLFGVAMQAQALVLTPGDADETTSINTNLTTLEEINDTFGTDYTDLELYYKFDVDSATEDGVLQDSYVFTDILDDSVDGVSGGDIVLTGDLLASCVDSDCFLIVKDGKHNPAQFLIDLSDWDGIETIELQDFWLDEGGSISNIQIWAAETTSVPEPGILAVFGAGLVGLGFARRRRTAA